MAQRNNTHINCNHVAGVTKFDIWKNECDPCEECIELIPNIKHWYRYKHGYQKTNGTFYNGADILTNITDGGNIKGWYDQITGTNHLVAAVGGNQPKYEDSDGSHYFKNSVKYYDFTSNVQFGANADFTLVVRYKHLNDNLAGSGITFFAEGANNLISWKSTTSFEINIGGGGVQTITGPVLDPDMEHNFVFRRTNGLVEIFVHGALWGTNASAPGQLDIDTFGAMDTPSEDENIKGYVTHISMYDRALDNHEIWCFESIVERVWTAENGTCECGGQSTNALTEVDCLATNCDGTPTWTPGSPCPSTCLVTVNTGQVSCYNGTDGELTATVLNCTGPFTYAWTGPNGYTSTSNPMTGAASGVYTVVVTDTGNANATVTATGVINNQSQVACSVAVNNITLANGALVAGDVTVTATGGVGGYTYQWATGGSPIGGATNQTYSTTTPGTYIVTVTDANGCSTTCSGSIVSDAPPLNILCTATNVDCNGDTDGAVSVWIDPNSAVYPVTVLIETGSYGSGVTVNSTTHNTAPAADTATHGSIGANTYYITVSDANSQTAQCTTTVTEPHAITASLTGVDPTFCDPLYPAGNPMSGDGTITINTISGGTLDPLSQCYAYNIKLYTSGGVLVTQQSVNNGDVIAFLPGDTYTWEIRDCNDCMITGTVTLTCPIPGDLTITTTDAPCIEDPTGAMPGQLGTATFTVSNNGANPLSDYQVTLSSSASATYTHNFGTTHPYTDSTIVPGTTYTAVFEGLNNGVWVVMSTQTFIVAYDPGISLAAVVTPVTCQGGNDGAIDITVSGGSPSYTYSWIGPNGFTATTEDISSLPHGDYQVTVTDSNGCYETEIYTVDDGQACTTSLTVQDITCHGLTDGAITLASLSQPCSLTAASFAWTGPSSFTATTPDITSLAAGTYNLTITTAAGCTVTDSATVTEPSAITTTMTIDTAITCRGACDGQISIALPTGGTGVYINYIWQYSIDGGTTWNGVSAVNISANSLTASNLCAALYRVKVYDSNDCEAVFSITLADGVSAVTGTAAVTPINYCGEMTCCGHIDFEPAPATQAPFTYQWTGPLGYSSTQQDVNCVLEPGPYTIVVTDKDGCTFTATYTMTAVNNPVVVVVTYDVATNTLTATASGGTTPYMYEWTLNGAPIGTGQTMLASGGSGYYCCKVTDANGCNTTECFSVTDNPGEYDSFNCTAAGCVGILGPSGTYATLQDCIDNCENTRGETKWICYQHACVTVATGMSGLTYYNTYADCVASGCQERDTILCDPCGACTSDADCSACDGCTCNDVTGRCESTQADCAEPEGEGACTIRQTWNSSTCECECNEEPAECEEGFTWSTTQCACCNGEGECM